MIRQRIFPFCQDIIWEIKNNKYVIPKLNTDQWNIILNKRNFYVLAQYGGLLENFMSLFFIEWLKKIKPNKSFAVVTKNDFIELFDLYNTPTILKNNSNIEKYSIPIFTDKSNNVYFNYLENYLTIKPYYGSLKGYTNYRQCLQQILEKFCIPNILEYNPFLSDKINNKKPQLLIIDNTKLSIHKPKLKNLSEINNIIDQNNKSFDITILTLEPFKYANSKHNIHAFSISKYIELIQKSDYVISAEIDYLLMSLFLSKATVISMAFRRSLNLKRNARFIKSDNKIVTLKKMSALNIKNVILNSKS